MLPIIFANKSVLQSPHISWSKSPLHNKANTPLTKRTSIFNPLKSRISPSYISLPWQQYKLVNCPMVFSSTSYRSHKLSVVISNGGTTANSPSTFLTKSPYSHSLVRFDFPRNIIFLFILKFVYKIFNDQISVGFATSYYPCKYRCKVKGKVAVGTCFCGERNRIIPILLIAYMKIVNHCCVFFDCFV